MPRNEKHEKLLQDVIDEFRSRGLKVLKITKPIPDAIVINGSNIETVAIEVTASKQRRKPYNKKLKYKRFGFDTDDLLIISKYIPNKHHVPPEAYYFALELRKKGSTYKEIQKTLKNTFNVKISTGSLCRWWKRGIKPLSVRNLEGIHRRNYNE